MKPILLYYDVLNYLPENKKLLEDKFCGLSFSDPSHDTPYILGEVNVILAPLGYYFGREKIDMMPNLKVIGSNTTGDAHIFTEYAEARGIKVVTLKGEHEFLSSITPTAELTFGLIITLTRNIIPAAKSVEAGNWSRWPFPGPKMLSKMSLGVVGCGRLGRMVAYLGACFGMDTRYYDPHVSQEWDGVERVDTLKELAASSDIITIHVPHETSTENLIDGEIFRWMKHGAYFINTSRGEVVDEVALLENLERGFLAGAAVDVLKGEFDEDFMNGSGAHTLIEYAKKNPNLIITPHIGGSTVDAWQKTQEFIIRKIIDISEGW